MYVCQCMHVCMYSCMPIYVCMYHGSSEQRGDDDRQTVMCPGTTCLESIFLFLLFLPLVIISLSATSPLCCLLSSQVLLVGHIPPGLTLRFGSTLQHTHQWEDAFLERYSLPAWLFFLRRLPPCFLPSAVMCLHLQLRLVCFFCRRRIVSSVHTPELVGAGEQNTHSHLCL